MRGYPRLLSSDFEETDGKYRQTARRAVLIMLPVLPVFLAGAVAAPLLKKIIKPVVRGTVKSSVKLAMDARRVAHEINEDLSDIAAEASAEAFAADLQEGPEVPAQTTKKTRSGSAANA
ncbi:DUF5132 domain-containing protein [Streptomyces sp. MS1.AVA.1]|uniref:DUF5132 domain-containing protein n=1 Tax=Streptomyces machairae TaxID=3134109 RepID=A0ABU8UX64_9ACTN